MTGNRPYTVIDRISVPEGAGHCRDQLTSKYGATSKFIRFDGALFEVYTYDDRFFVIDQRFSKRRGQLFDTFLCEVAMEVDYV